MIVDSAEEWYVKPSGKITLGESLKINVSTVVIFNCGICCLFGWRNCSCGDVMEYFTC
jgi:hypothetical protein